MDVVTSFEPIGAWGMGIVSAQAFVAGAASIPGPYTDVEWDGWFAHGFWGFRQTAAGTVGNLVVNSQFMEIDNKAMRKINDTDVMVVMAESQADAARVSIQFRMLVKLL